MRIKPRRGLQGFAPEARWNWDESFIGFSSLIEHDLFGKPLHTFPDHALSRRKRLGAGRIEQAHAPGDDLDDPVALELGEGAADGLDSQTEIIGNVLPAHRQWQGG